jgi:hypothetical protein
LAFQGKWRNSAEEWRQRETSSEWRWALQILGSFREVFWTCFFNIFGKWYLNYYYIESIRILQTSSNPEFFFFCQRPDVDVVVHRRTWRWMDQGPKKMIGIWSDMALSGNRWNMMPIINPYRYCVWSVNDVWSSFYQSDPIRRFGPQELDNAWRSNWGVGARFPQRFSFLHAVTWRMSR